MFSLKMTKKKRKGLQVECELLQARLVVSSLKYWFIPYQTERRQCKKAFAKQPAVIKLAAPSRDYSLRKCRTRPFSPDALVWAHIKGNLQTGFHSAASNCDLYFISQMLRAAAERLFIRRCTIHTLPLRLFWKITSFPAPQERRTRETDPMMSRYFFFRVNMVPGEIIHAAL